MNFSISSNYLNEHTHFEKLFNDTFFTSIELHEDHINKNIIDNQIEVSALIPNTDFYNQLNINNSSVLSDKINLYESINCLLYTSPSPRDKRQSRMPSSA